MEKLLKISDDALERLKLRESFHMSKAHIISDATQFPSIGKIINSSSNETGVTVPLEDIEKFDKCFREALLKACNVKSDQAESDLAEFMRTNRSNGHTLQLQIMAIPKSQWFRIHAHPSLEFIYVLMGVMKELRMVGPLICKEILEGPIQKNSPLEGPKINSSAIFEELQTSKGGIIVNEVGSVHQSYTTDGDGCILFALWCGCHANSHPSLVLSTDKRLRPDEGWEI